MILMGLQDLLDTCEPRDPANRAAAGHFPSSYPPPLDPLLSYNLPIMSCPVIIVRKSYTIVHY